jgi:2-iminobutanoate/2-iminopropanoate deaminase
MKEIVKTNKAPEAIGPYSQAVKTENFVFTAGQIAIPPQSKDLVEGGVAEQTKQVLENLQAILEAAGSEFSSVIRTTVYLTKPENFTPMNDVYSTFFTDQPPARVTVFVDSLPKGALVEIDAIARL